MYALHCHVVGIQVNTPFPTPYHLQCLSDVAQLRPLASLLTAADVDALTKGAVACILERSSNADNDVVAAIVASGCIDAWVRHLQFATTSKELKVSSHSRWAIALQGTPMLIIDMKSP